MREHLQKSEVNVLPLSSNAKFILWHKFAAKVRNQASNSICSSPDPVRLACGSPDRHHLG